MANAKREVGIGMEWIRVKDRKPPPLENVLLMSTYKTLPIIIGSWNNIFKEWDLQNIGYFMFDTGIIRLKGLKKNSVSHWMPLPEPPKEGMKIVINAVERREETVWKMNGRLKRIY